MPGCAGWKLVKRDVALLSNYLFFRIDADLYPHWVESLSMVAGALTIVSCRDEPVVVRERDIADLRAVADVDGMVSSEDISKHSYKFRALVGELVKFKDNSALPGQSAKVVSLAFLDKTGKVGVDVELLGSRRSIDVDYRQLELRPTEKRLAAA